jgi:Tfp pilus assembly protein PilF
MARIDRVLEELPMDVEARKLRAGIYMSMGAPEKALLDAREAVKLNPTDGEAQLLVCEAAVRSGEVDAALVGLNLSADLLLEQSTFHVRLSRCAIDLNEYDAAEAYARTALAGNARSAEANLQLARVFVLVGENEKAVTVLERAIQSRVLSVRVIRKDPIFNDLVDELG